MTSAFRASKTKVIFGLVGLTFISCDQADEGKSKENAAVPAEQAGAKEGGSEFRAAPIPGSKTYTLDADFDAGTLINVTHNIADELRLDDTTAPFGFIWIANSGKGTIVKIDTETGNILGEYRTSPDGTYGNPSRTTVDANGNVWTGNRQGVSSTGFASVVHVGLVENGQCEDRNGNGTIETSTGLGDVRAWSITDRNGGVGAAQDECIIHNVVMPNSSDARHLSVDGDNNLWVSGLTSRVFRLVDGQTGAVLRTESSVGYGGYGGLIDADGVIWSARNLLRWDTANPLSGGNGGNWNGYSHDSYGLCIDGDGNVWNTALSGGQILKFAADGTLLGTFEHGDQNAQGCVVDSSGDVWVAHSLFNGKNTIGHLRNDGTFVGNVALDPAGNAGPTGVAVDRVGKIWATGHNSQKVYRIDPSLGAVGGGGVAIGAVDFTTPALGGILYNYSDMTGSTLTAPPGAGTWEIVHDGIEPAQQWGKISWNAEVPDGAELSVSVVASEDGITWGPSQPAVNGADLVIEDARYLKVTVVFKRGPAPLDGSSFGESPVLYDLTIEPANAAPEITCSDKVIAVPSNSCVACASVVQSVSDPDGDNVTVTEDPDCTVTPLPPGSYTIGAEAQDESGATASCSATLTIEDQTPPVPTCAADQSVVLSEDSCTASQSAIATATDNCSPLAPQTQSVDFSGPGTKTLSYSFSDAFGNSASCSTAITALDQGSPVAQCSSGAFECTGELTPVLTSCVGTDTCDAAPSTSSDALPAYPLGTALYSCTVSDASGNTSMQSCELAIVDTAAPQAVCTDVNVECTGPSTSVVTSCEAIDVCEGQVAATSSGLASYPFGAHPYTCSASDSSGNAHAATCTVNIVDTVAPEVACVDVVTECTGALTPVETSCTGSDTCDENVDGESNALASYPLGAATFQCSATDAGGNTTSQTCNVEIIDTTAPILQLGTNGQLSACDGASAQITLALPSVNDGCQGALAATGFVVARNGIPLSVPVAIGVDGKVKLGVGTYTVLWSATDSSGNSVSTYETIVVAPSADFASCCGRANVSDIFGTNNADNINYFNDTKDRDIDGRGGYDVISTGTGNDCLIGGLGDDNMTSTKGNDVYYGGEGSDTLSACIWGGGNLLAYGGPGRDNIVAQLCDSTTIYGGAGPDNITGSAKVDTVYPGSGIDNVNTGSGNDTVILLHACEIDAGETLDGGTGTDTLISPVSVDELRAAGVTVRRFENVIISQNDAHLSDCFPIAPDGGPQ
jgi:streptogramin lyase